MNLSNEELDFLVKRFFKFISESSQFKKLEISISTIREALSRFASAKITYQHDGRDYSENERNVFEKASNLLVATNGQLFANMGKALDHSKSVIKDDKNYLNTVSDLELADSSSKSTSPGALKNSSDYLFHIKALLDAPNVSNALSVKMKLLVCTHKNSSYINRDRLRGFIILLNSYPHINKLVISETKDLSVDQLYSDFQQLIYIKEFILVDKNNLQDELTKISHRNKLISHYKISLNNAHEAWDKISLRILQRNLNNNDTLFISSENSPRYSFLELLKFISRREPLYKLIKFRFKNIKINLMEVNKDQLGSVDVLKNILNDLSNFLSGNKYFPFHTINLQIDDANDVFDEIIALLKVSANYYNFKTIFITVNRSLSPELYQELKRSYKPLVTSCDLHIYHEGKKISLTELSSKNSLLVRQAHRRALSLKLKKEQQVAVGQSREASLVHAKIVPHFIFTPSSSHVEKSIFFRGLVKVPSPKLPYNPNSLISSVYSLQDRTRATLDLSLDRKKQLVDFCVYINLVTERYPLSVPFKFNKDEEYRQSLELYPIKSCHLKTLVAEYRQFFLKGEGSDADKQLAKIELLAILGRVLFDTTKCYIQEKKMISALNIVMENESVLLESCSFANDPFYVAFLVAIQWCMGHTVDVACETMQEAADSLAIVQSFYSFINITPRLLTTFPAKEYESNNPFLRGSPLNYNAKGVHYSVAAFFTLLHAKLTITGHNKDCKSILILQGADKFILDVCDKFHITMNNTKSNLDKYIAAVIYKFVTSKFFNIKELDEDSVSDIFYFIIKFINTDDHYKHFKFYLKQNQNEYDLFPTIKKWIISAYIASRLVEDEDYVIYSHNGRNHIHLIGDSPQPTWLKYSLDSDVYSFLITRINFEIVNKKHPEPVLAFQVSTPTFVSFSSKNLIEHYQAQGRVVGLTDVRVTNTEVKELFEDFYFKVFGFQSPQKEGVFLGYELAKRGRLPGDGSINKSSSHAHARYVYQETSKEIEKGRLVAIVYDNINEHDFMAKWLKRKIPNVKVVILNQLMLFRENFHKYFSPGHVIVGTTKMFNILNDHLFDSKPPALGKAPNKITLIETFLSTQRYQDRRRITLSLYGTVSVKNILSEKEMACYCKSLGESYPQENDPVKFNQIIEMAKIQLDLTSRMLRNEYNIFNQVVFYYYNLFADLRLSIKERARSVLWSLTWESPQKEIDQLWQNFFNDITTEWERVFPGYKDASQMSLDKAKEELFSYAESRWALLKGFLKQKCTASKIILPVIPSETFSSTYLPLAPSVDSVVEGESVIINSIIEDSIYSDISKLVHPTIKSRAFKRSIENMFVQAHEMFSFGIKTSTISSDPFSLKIYTFLTGLLHCLYVANNPDRQKYCRNLLDEMLNIFSKYGSEEDKKFISQAYSDHLSFHTDDNYYCQRLIYDVRKKQLCSSMVLFSDNLALWRDIYRFAHIQLDEYEKSWFFKASERMERLRMLREKINKIDGTTKNIAELLHVINDATLSISNDDLAINTIKSNSFFPHRNVTGSRLQQALARIHDKAVRCMMNESELSAIKNNEFSLIKNLLVLMVNTARLEKLKDHYVVMEILANDQLIKKINGLNNINDLWGQDNESVYKTLKKYQLQLQNTKYPGLTVHSFTKILDDLLEKIEKLQLLNDHTQLSQTNWQNNGCMVI